jgi:TatD DNase family protein
MREKSEKLFPHFYIAKKTERSRNFQFIQNLYKIELVQDIFPFIDFHNHSEWHGEKVIEVVSIHNNQDKKARFYTIGFHPWWTEKLLDESQLNFLKVKYISDQHCLGLGEFGLDNLKGAPLDLQEATAIQQIKLANELKAPVILHCVRAYDRLIRLKKDFGQTPWVVHGYMRNKILARQLLDAGMKLSVAPQLQMKDSFLEMMQYIPITHVFLETDSDFRLNITERYRIFASLKKMGIEPLKAQLYQNFKTFYQEKWKYQSGWSAQHY